MKLYDIEKIAAHGGSLRCFIKNSGRIKETARCKKLLISEKKALHENAFLNFNYLIKKNSYNLKKKLQIFKSSGKKVIGYGAPARVATITNFSKIDSNLIEYIIDDSPLKQGRFSPGMHIKIKSRNNNLKNIDVVIVFAYEYFIDIKKYFKNNKVLFYKPIPFGKL